MCWSLRYHRLRNLYRRINMQPDLNNILQNKGFLQLTREYPREFFADESNWSESPSTNALSLDSSSTEILTMTLPPFSLSDGTQLQLLDTGVLLIEPAENQGSDIVISSGVHGNETAPIEMVDTIAEKIIKGELKVNNRLLLIIGNPVAMNQGQRFDIENMNRLFGKKSLSRVDEKRSREKLSTEKPHHEMKRAAALESFVKQFFLRSDEGSASQTRLHFDLHTAIRPSKYQQFAIYPYPDGKAWDKRQLEFFGACGISTVLLGHQPSGTFSYFSSHTFGAHAFTVELGQVKPFGENKAEDFAKMLANLMALINGQVIETKPFDNEDFLLFQVVDELIKTSDNFRLNFAESGANFTDFTAGYPLAEDVNGGYIIKQDEDAIVFPNSNIPNGQRAGLIVRKTKI